MSQLAQQHLTVRQKLHAYVQLTRLDRPIGSELLLWPTLWAVWLAGEQSPQHATSWQIVLIFILGVIFMRSAGCAINDFADRHVDGQIERTKNRPLASGKISSKEALAVFGVLLLASASLLLFLPLQTLYWSFGAVFLAALYPFMKRWTYLPQFVLGAAFSWGIPMAFVAQGQSPGLVCWLLYIANLCWTVAYDTQYAMTDRADDLKAGVKSTAILFGRYDLLIIGILQIVFIVLMVQVFSLLQLGFVAYLGLGFAVILFVLQFLNTRDRLPAHTFKAFLNNAWVGRGVWLSVVVALAVANQIS
ncbi:4-hydroxybenzoate octaprenyltransferase [Aquirhabdus sp.]|uniref:4-hydroxybenzoate octaprenyltransferase n=1 Tax=Aquirhabdus sp. TaxID=2824160 RepID=UPI00396C9F34